MREDGTNQQPAFYKTEKVRYSFVLADLGIAALEDDRFSDFIRGIGNRNPTLVDGHDHALGTPGYAAPEQMSGQNTSTAADIHALGVLFDRLKADGERLFKSMGMNMSVAITVFIQQSLQRGKLPFEILGDPFYSESSQRELGRRAREMDLRKNASEHDLIDAGNLIHA